MIIGTKTIVVHALREFVITKGTVIIGIGILIHTKRGGIARGEIVVSVVFLIILI